jgi:hypothetical protein
VAVLEGAAASKNVFATEIKSLPDDLEALANSVDYANKTAFAPGSFSKKSYALAFRWLPGIMRGYAAIYRHIQHQVTPLRKRRITLVRVWTIDLMAKVESYTGRAHCEEIAILLTKGFGIQGPDNEMPKFFHTDTLAKLPRDLRKSRRHPTLNQEQKYHLPKPPVPNHLPAGK